MKKFCLISFVLALVLLFSSCGMIFDMIENAAGNDEPDYGFEQFETENDFIRTDASVEVIQTEPYTETEPTSADVPVETEPELIAVDIAPIVESVFDVEPYPEIPAYSVPVSFLVYEGNISSNGATQSCTITAPETGVYSFYVDMMSDLKLNIEVLDSKNARVIRQTNISGGGGVTCDLVKDGTYTVLVTGYSGVGNYTLTIGQQKADVALTGATYIADAIEFNNQENYYTYTPAVSGIHRFYISGINSDCTVSVYVYDSQGYRLQYSTNLSRDEGVNEVLTAGETYRIGVVEYSGLGAYTLNVGVQKPTVDLTGCNTVSDSIQFADQENYYSFTTVNSGEYRFEVSKIESGNSVSFYVFDDEGYRLQYSTNLDSGDGLNVELDGGKTYTLCVTEYSGFVPYTFIIGAPKDAVDITGYDIVNDSIQFNGQKNVYSFTADRSGDHDFVISNTQNGFSCSVYVYDSDGYRIDYGTSLSDDEYVSVGLDQGETYTVEVVYYSGYGEYSLLVY